MLQLIEQRHRLFAVLLWRGVATCLVLLLTLWLYWPFANVLEQRNLMSLGLLWLAVIAIQGLLCRYLQAYFLAQLFFQFVSDLLLIAVLTFVTGGFDSPFVVLFGLVIVSAGTQARVLLVLAVSVLGSVAYLSSVYLFAWLQKQVLPSEATLQLLLQTSIFWLVGGVMALIARRHATLMVESHRARQEHHNLQHLHSDLMASMQDGILVLDVDLNVVDCNPAFLKVLNQRSFRGVALSLLGDFPEALMASLSSTKNDLLRMEWSHGEASYLLTTGYFSQAQTKAYAWLSLLDITPLRQLEMKLAEQERLASLGRLAAMLAHEFRNPMQTIAQATELMPQLPEKKQKKVQGIVIEEVHRLNCLITDMLDYAKPLHADLMDVDVRFLVEDVLHQTVFLPHDIGMDVLLESLHVDQHHWRRVLENLLNHAVGASPTPATVHVMVWEEDGDWCLKVSDCGAFLSEDMRFKMFEPFGVNRKGTGLGLATVWQICKADGWKLNVESNQNVTCVCVKARMCDEVNGG